MYPEDNILPLLVSDKATHRKRGRDELEKLIKQDYRYCVIPNRKWSEVITKCMEWEDKEMNHAQKKGLAINTLYMNVSEPEILTVHPDHYCRRQYS
jgi:hypothetical protein